jgi:hypothetical protein
VVRDVDAEGVAPIFVCFVESGCVVRGRWVPGVVRCDVLVVIGDAEEDAVGTGDAEGADGLGSVPESE